MAANGSRPSAFPVSTADKISHLTPAQSRAAPASPATLADDDNSDHVCAPTAMSKTSRSSDSRDARRHNPLAEDYTPTHPLKQKAGKKRKSLREDDEGEHYVDSKSSRKILKIGQDLAEEDQQEQKALYAPAANPAFAFESRFGAEEDADEQDASVHDDDEAWGDEEEEEIVEEVVCTGLHPRCRPWRLTASRNRRLIQTTKTSSIASTPLSTTPYYTPEKKATARTRIWQISS